jgi:hypothetical protein
MGQDDRSAGVAVDRVGGHRCVPAWADGELFHDGYGTAVTYCEENDVGEFWVGNGEYGSRVNFCPFCGKQSPTPVTRDSQCSSEPSTGPYSLP